MAPAVRRGELGEDLERGACRISVHCTRHADGIGPRHARLVGEPIAGERCRVVPRDVADRIQVGKREQRACHVGLRNVIEAQCRLSVALEPDREERACEQGGRGDGRHGQERQQGLDAEAEETKAKADDQRNDDRHVLPRTLAHEADLPGDHAPDAVRGARCERHHQQGNARVEDEARRAGDGCDRAQDRGVEEEIFPDA